MKDIYKDELPRDFLKTELQLKLFNLQLVYAYLSSIGVVSTHIFLQLALYVFLYAQNKGQEAEEERHKGLLTHKK
jgi:hypothetical protein